jgi:hypothetical protein
MFNDFADAINWQVLPDENASDDGTSSTPPPTDNQIYGPITEKF